MIFAYIWGANVKGLFTALRCHLHRGRPDAAELGRPDHLRSAHARAAVPPGDWIQTAQAKGKVGGGQLAVDPPETSDGLQITPNSVLAAASFTNLSRPAGEHSLTVTSIFALDDPPDRVCEVLARVASNCRSAIATARRARSCRRDGISHQDPAELTGRGRQGQGELPGWIWYAARREGLISTRPRTTSTIEAVADAIHDVVGPTFRPTRDEQQDLIHTPN